VRGRQRWKRTSRKPVSAPREDDAPQPDRAAGLSERRQATPGGVAHRDDRGAPAARARRPPRAPLRGVGDPGCAQSRSWTSRGCGVCERIEMYAPVCSRAVRGQRKRRAPARGAGEFRSTRGRSRSRSQIPRKLADPGSPPLLFAAKGCPGMSSSEGRQVRSFTSERSGRRWPRPGVATICVTTRGSRFKREART